MWKRTLVMWGALWMDHAALACSCPNSPPFLEVVEKHQDIGHGTVIAYGPGDTPEYMDVQIDRVLRGDLGDRIRIWGDNGIQCRPYVQQFPVGATFVWALFPEGTTADHHFISACGQYSLSSDGTTVSGPIRTDTVEDMLLDDLQAALGPAGTRHPSSLDSEPDSGCNTGGRPTGWLLVGLMLAARRQRRA